MKRALISAALALAVGQSAKAEDKPAIAPAPRWVEPATIPDARADQASALQPLVSDVQFRFGPDATDIYLEQALKVRDPVGLAHAGTFSVSWRPNVDTLTIH